MRFNSLIPELTVSDIEKTKEFYINVLSFRIEYERPEDKFVFLSLEGNQLMFEFALFCRAVIPKLIPSHGIL